MTTKDGGSTPVQSKLPFLFYLSCILLLVFDTNPAPRMDASHEVWYQLSDT